jgi:uncharacterized protein (UPF0335 family)
MYDGKTPKNEYEAALVVIERLEKEKAQLVKALEKIVFDWDGEPEDMFEAKEALTAAKAGGGR